MALALAGCGERPRHDERSAAPVDPATVQALAAPLLTDPDLTTQSRGFAVLSDPEPVEPALPPDDGEDSAKAATR